MRAGGTGQLGWVDRRQRQMGISDWGKALLPGDTLATTHRHNAVVAKFVDGVKELLFRVLLFFQVPVFPGLVNNGRVCRFNAFEHQVVPGRIPVSYPLLRAHETVLDLVCCPLL